MNKPIVSILLPTYNRGYILNRAIESVLQQTLLNWELLIIDDGSVDKTDSVVARYLDDVRIKFFKTNHQGPVAARNFGFKQSNGEIISFLDSDDWYDKDHLSLSTKYLLDNPVVDFIKTKLVVLGDRFVRDVRDLNKLIDVEECCVQGTFLVKSQVIKSLGGLPEVPYGADYIFYNLAKDSGFIIHDLNVRTYFFDRTGKDSITKKMMREYSEKK